MGGSVPVSGNSAFVPLLMTVDEVAVCLRVSSKTVRRLIGSGELRQLRVARRVLVRRTEVEKFIARQENLCALAS